MLMKKCSVMLLVGLMAAASFAAETLFSNYALNVNEAGKPGALWVFSRGDIYSGATLLTLNLGTSGVQVSGSEQGQVSDSMTAVQDGIFSDVLAEHRRTPSVYAGKLGYVLPMVGLDDEGNHLQPSGFLSVRGVDNIVETPFEVFEAMEDLDSAMHGLWTRIRFCQESALDGARSRGAWIVRFFGQGLSEKGKLCAEYFYRNFGTCQVQLQVECQEKSVCI